MEGFSGQMPFLLLMLVVFFLYHLATTAQTKKEKNFMKNLSKEIGDHQKRDSRQSGGTQ